MWVLFGAKSSLACLANKVLTGSYVRRAALSTSLTLAFSSGFWGPVRISKILCHLRQSALHDHEGVGDVDALRPHLRVLHRNRMEDRRNDGMDLIPERTPKTSVVGKTASNFKAIVQMKSLANESTSCIMLTIRPDLRNDRQCIYRKETSVNVCQTPQGICRTQKNS